MNSQQELLDAINTISQSKDRSCDTPATVLRVEGDTVWVHIDGGADETPVQKTINCEQGETVQVRISNGSAFLVGNASAPPTDDKTANVAHFVATQAEENVENLERTVVEEYVAAGGSNIHNLSSTMYQNEYGVNIYNNTLDVGDSYAHIDGDSFDIKKATTAGTIDDANDTMLASFGREITVGERASGSSIGFRSQVYGYNCVASGSESHAEGSYAEASGDVSHAEGIYATSGGISSHAEGYHTVATGDYSHAEGGYTESSGDYSHVEGSGATASGDCSHAEGVSTSSSGMFAHAQNQGTLADSKSQTAIGKYNVSDANDTYALIIGNGTADNARSDALRVDWSGNVLIDGEVQDLSGNNKYLSAKVLTSTTISAATTSYTFSDAAIKTTSVIDIYDTIFGFAPTGMTVSAGSATITFPAQSSSHTIKLFVY